MIFIYDYGVGNISSITNILNHHNYKYIVSNNFKKINISDKLIFPGIGNIKYVLDNMPNKKKLVEFVTKNENPVLGICIGMHILLTSSEEDSSVTGLSFFENKVKKINSVLKNYKTTHIGLHKTKFLIDDDKIFKGIKQNSKFYYVHSFYVPEKKKYSIANFRINNELSASAIIKKNNIYGLQFHPERSGDNGIKMIANFSNL